MSSGLVLVCVETPTAADMLKNKLLQDPQYARVGLSLGSDNTVNGSERFCFGRFDYFTKCDNCKKAIMEKRNQKNDSLVLSPGE
jgi:hypothetical protein